MKKDMEQLKMLTSKVTAALNDLKKGDVNAARGGGVSQLISKAAKPSAKENRFRRSDHPLGSESTNLKQAKMEPFTTKGTSSVATRKPSASLSECLDLIDRTLRSPVEPGKKTLNIAAKKKDELKARGSKVGLTINKVNDRTSIDLRIASYEEETTERALKCLSALMFAIIEDWIGFATAYEESVPANPSSLSSMVPPDQRKLDELMKPPKKRHIGNITPVGGMATKAKRTLFGTISTPTSALSASSSGSQTDIPAEEKLKVGLLNLPFALLYLRAIDTHSTGSILLHMNTPNYHGELITSYPFLRAQA